MNILRHGGITKGCINFKYTVNHNSTSTPIPLLASPLKGEEPSPFPFRGESEARGMGVGYFWFDKMKLISGILVNPYFLTCLLRKELNNLIPLFIYSALCVLSILL